MASPTTLSHEPGARPEGEDTIRPSAMRGTLASPPRSPKTLFTGANKPLPGTPGSLDMVMDSPEELTAFREGSEDDHTSTQLVNRSRGGSSSSSVGGEDVFVASEGTRGGQMGDVHPSTSIRSSPETPLARRRSIRSIKRSVEAAKASQMLSQALSGDSPPPTVVKRTSSLRQQPSVSSQLSLLPIPERSASFPAPPSADTANEALSMPRSASETLLESVPLSFTPSTDSETQTSASGSTRTSASVVGLYSGRMSTASSSFTYDTDCSSPYAPEDKAPFDTRASSSADPDGVGLGISADYAITSTVLEETGRSRSRSRSSPIAHERIWSPSHSRFSSRSSSASSNAQDKVVRSLPGADVTDLFVPADSTSLILSGAAKGIEMLLLRCLPILTANLTSLDLSQTGLRTIPPIVAGCKNLRELSLSGNRFQGGSLPTLLPELLSLRKLVLDGCRLAHLTTSLAPISELHTLSLRYNALRALPTWLPEMPALEHLFVDGNPFTEHWATLTMPLLDPRSPINATMAHSLARKDQMVESSDTQDCGSADVAAPQNQHSKPPSVPRPGFSLKKMQSLGELRLPTSVIGTLSSAATSSAELPGLPAENTVDTLPPADYQGVSPSSAVSLPEAMQREGSSTGSLGKKKGFFGGMRVGHQGRAKSSRSSNEDLSEAGDSSKSTRFLATGFRRIRTNSSMSSKLSVVDAAVSVPANQVSPTRPAFSDTASVHSSRPGTSMSFRLPFDRFQTRPSTPAGPEEDEESEVLNGNVMPPNPVVDAPSGLRMLMAYLRDLDDLSAQDHIGGRNRPSSARSARNGPTISRNNLGRSTSSSTTDSNTGGSACSSPSLNVNGYPSPQSVNMSPTLGLALKYINADDFKLKNDSSKREKVLREIVMTEQSYVRSLDELVEIYVRPASEIVGDSPIVPITERRAVFSNVEDILRFHTAVFLPDLQTAMLHLESSPLVSSDDFDGATHEAAVAVANVFAQHAAYLKMYAVYITAFDEALARIQTWTAPDSGLKVNGGPSSRPSTGSTVASSTAPDTSPIVSQLSSSQRKKMKSYLKHCRAHPKHSQINCESYLLLPVQRIPRYKMLLESLLSCTPIDNGSDEPLALHPKMATALELVSALASDLNERKREAEGRKRLLVWQNRIGATRFRSPLVQPHRVLLREGPVLLSRVVKRATAYTESRPGTATSGSPTDTRPNILQVPSLQIKSEMKSLVALLCSDILVLVYDSGPTSVELYTVFRPSANRKAPASSFGGDGMLRIVDSRAILYLKCANNEEAESWASLINEKLSTH